MASWSSLEYTGKWKHLNYHAKRFYAPVAILAAPAIEDADPAAKPVPGVITKLDIDDEPEYVINNNVVEIWAVNDRRALAKTKTTVELWNYASGRLETLNYSAEVPAGSAVKLASLPLEHFGTEKERRNRFLSLELNAEVDGKLERHRNEWFFAPYKQSELAQARVTASPAEKNGKWTVTLSTDKPALYVWANAEGIAGEFDDNSLLLLPGRPVTLTFTPKGKSTFAAFKAALKIKHLAQTFGR